MVDSSLEIKREILASPSLFNLLCLLTQANRSRDLGAIVYCVGVKDFNETQV